jgi:hypothetical protein
VGSGVIGELLSAPGALGAFGLALLIFVRLIADPDRRRELQAELFEVPRWEQPFWVAQQFEVALRVGVLPQVSWHWGRWVWHRCKIESGLESHRKYPDTFEIPSDDDKAELRPGDTVRLTWSVKRYSAAGERMWVEITHRDGDQVVGRLRNWPVFVHLNPDEIVKFHIDDIIDCHFYDDVDEADAA